jgi:hypothetical protein
VISRRCSTQISWCSSDWSRIPTSGPVSTSTGWLIEARFKSAQIRRNEPDLWQDRERRSERLR